MSDFKPTERTVVTESRSFIVDKHSRSPLNRANQSAYIGLDQLTVTDVNVTDTEHFTTSVSKHLTVICPSPVILSLTSSEPIPQPDIPSSGYNDATVIANDFIIGNDLVITVVDDTPLSAVNVVLLCSTGETESLTLTRANDNVFIGKISTSLQGSWTSFDSVLHPENNNEVSIMYTDTRSSTGKPKQIKTTVKAISPYSDAQIMVPPMLHLGRLIGVVIEDRDLDDAVGSIELEYEVEGVVRTLQMLRTDRPYGSVFVGTIDSGDMYLEIGDTITFRYNDPRDANGFPKVIERQSMVVPQTNVTGEITLPEFSGYGSYFLRLRDQDITGHSVQMIAMNERTQQFIPVTCDETVYGSGEFVGQLILTDVAGSGTLVIADGDTVRVTYVDQDVQSGGSSLVQERATFTVPDAPPAPTEPPVFVPGTVDMQIDGLFTLFGSFNGTITIKGLSDTAVRCNIVVA